MLKKRLIGVITVKNGWAVQSIGYQRYLPLGKPWCLAENLDRWGVDEILIQSVDRSPNGLGPDISLLKSLRRAKLSTPLIYGGGISTGKDAIAAIHAGADRITLDAVLHKNPTIVYEMAEALGTQALIGALPVSNGIDGSIWYDYRENESKQFSPKLIQLFIEGVLSEALIIDWQHEGCFGEFNPKITDNLPFETPKIAFGGISNKVQVQKLLCGKSIVAVAIGNFLSYREHVVQQFKVSLEESRLRPPIFQTTI
jgi:imidazole glycerol-phosphate synthase subunit HisF